MGAVVTPGAKPRASYDVVVIGTGLAGLTLARHLLLYTSKTVLLLDRREDPAEDAPQKYGESLVQCSGYYLSRVLDLEEHLLVRHYLKYNLRFHWTTAGLPNTGFEHYSQSFARRQSNIATFQLDRNELEAHLRDITTRDARCDFAGGVRDVTVDFGAGAEPHRVRWSNGDVHCQWVVDASGRARVLAKQLGLAKPNSIRHGATFFWVDGLVNVEKLSGRTHEEYLYDRQRQKTGQFPFYLATNHFAADGQWFWVIPLHDKTSLGLVYDHNAVDADDVSTPAKLIEYVCRKWPLFARDLPYRTIVEHGRIADFSYDCRQTISADRWAIVGEAGRFSDPLYSPGSDLIGIYNTLIVNAIATDDDAALADTCALAEQIERVMYESYVPTYATSYDCLGDQEAFSLKYTWELATYFGFFVLPMINGLFANRDFMRPFLHRFAILGSINANLQRLLSAFYQWKKAQPSTSRTVPELFEFYDMQPLVEAEKLFYQVGLSPAEAIAVVDGHVERLQEFARYILAHINARVIGDVEALTNGPFVASLKLRDAVFDPDAMTAAFARHKGAAAVYPWTLNPLAMADRVRPREHANESTYQTLEAQVTR